MIITNGVKGKNFTPQISGNKSKQWCWRIDQKLEMHKSLRETQILLFRNSIQNSWALHDGIDNSENCRHASGVFLFFLLKKQQHSLKVSAQCNAALKTTLLKHPKSSPIFFFSAELSPVMKIWEVLEKTQIKFKKIEPNNGEKQRLL